MTRECPDCGAELQTMRVNVFALGGIGPTFIRRCPWTTGPSWQQRIVNGIAACGRPYQRSRDAGWIER